MPKINEVPNLVYVLALSFCSLCVFLFTGNHTAFEWTTTQDIPFILRLIDPEFLPNDFYTNSVIGSPRFVFSYIVYGITLLGVDWYTTLYLLKLLLVLCVPPLLFLATHHIFMKWHPAAAQFKSYSTIVIMLFLCALGLFAAAFEKTIIFNRPFGWASIQLFAANTVSPMSLSFFFGLLYNIASFQYGMFRHFSPLLLLTSTLIHPVIGMCHFMFSLTFKLPIDFKKRSLVKLGVDFLIGIIGATVVLFLFKNNTVNLQANTFIDIYVYLRHPHHYLMSSMFGWRSIFWVLFFLFPIFLSFKAKEKKYLLLSVMVFVSFMITPIIQFLGTEVWKVKEVAIIGPSRFTGYASIFWTLNAFIVGFSIYKHDVFLGLEKLATPLRFAFYLIKKLHDNFRVVAYLFIAVSVGTFYFTHRHPLAFYEKKNVSEIIHWISKKTSEDSVFFVRDLDSFLVRVYGKRAVFSDDAFPFNERNVEEFSKRYRLHLKAKNFTPADYACLRDYYKLDYLIIPKKSGFSGYIPLFSNDTWLIYDVVSFQSKGRCTSSPEFKSKLEVIHSVNLD